MSEDDSPICVPCLPPPASPDTKPLLFPGLCTAGASPHRWKPVSLLPALPARCPSPTVQPLLSCLRLASLVICEFKIDRQGEECCPATQL
jgi:hypothetical protein